MALAVESSGTQTAVIATEHQLAAPTTNQCRVLRVDLGAMTSTDTVEIRVKTAVLTAGTIRDQLYQTYVNTVGTPIVETIPVGSNQGATFTLKQTAGTGRAFPWVVLTTGITMAVESSGTQTAVIGTTHNLPGVSPTTNKTRVLRVDLGAMVIGDVTELRIQTPVLAAGAVRDQYYETFAHVAGVAIIESDPISSNQGATFTLRQTAGTGRAYPWAILTLD
jgi:hypothetical protein